jgi:diamine N-acetyltransferase
MIWQIRPASPDDGPDLARFGGETFLETFGHLYPEDDKAFFLAERFSLERTLEDIKEHGRYIQLAFRNEALVGFIDCGPLSLPVQAPEPSALEIYRLYVARSEFGTGLGKALMLAALGWARSEGAPALYLGVFNANQRAQAFYHKFGFDIVGAYLFKVGNTLDDERIMRLGMS